MLKIFIVFIFLFVLSFGAEQQSTNTSITTTTTIPKKRRGYYVCPPNFVRLSHRCYYFSQETATWQDAYFHCRDLHSNLAIIRNSNQDKLIRRTLSKKTLKPLERWLGGRYDWEQMSWKWAASGKPVQYQSFTQINDTDKESLKWHCIIVDPNLQYRWNSRSCLDKKHYICQTKIHIVVSDHGKKKLLRQYNVTKFNQLNEVPVPVLINDTTSTTYQLKGHKLNTINLNTDAAYRIKPSKQRKRNKLRKRKRVRNETIDENNTIDNYDRPQREQVSFINNNNNNKNNNGKKQKRRPKYKNDKDEISMEWKMYLKDAVKPYHPKPIVEEFNYIKDS